MCDVVALPERNGADAHLPGGALWPIPVTLDIGNDLAEKIGVGDRLALPPGMDVPTALAQFGAQPAVEWVGPIPKPVGTPAVPDLVSPGGISGDIAADRYQKYLDPAPAGIRASHSARQRVAMSRVELSPGPQ